MLSAKAKKIITYSLITIGILLLVGWLGKDSFDKYKTTQFFKSLEKEALAEEFRGIETSSGKISDLFPIQATGVSTAPILQAAEVFLNSLDASQKEETSFDIQDAEWRKWSNVDNGIYKRQGISLKDMNEAQRKAAFSLLQISLSAKGLQLSKDIMKTDQTLREFHDDSPDFDEELYFFTFMGTPSQTEPWGWQLDGHHLIINYFVLGDQVVMTPTFMGAEPVFATAGKYKGNVLFQDEQNLGLAFMNALSSDQKKLATLSSTKKHGNNKTESE